MRPSSPSVAKRDARPRASRAPIDWRDIERRLEAARAAVERVWLPSAADIRRILEERAAVLAREAAPSQAADAGIEVIEFLLAREHYAVAAEYVRGVYALQDITPLPCTPAFVRGIVNLRGEMMSVIDIGTFFDLPGKGLTDLDKLIVLDSGVMTVGVLADAIGGARRILRAGIQAVPPTLAGIHAEYLQGVTAERVAVIDAGKLLGDERLIVREQVT